MELEVERRRDVGIRILLKGQIDVEADGLSARFVGAEVGRFHDAGAAAGGDDKAMALGGDLRRPFGEHVGEPAGVFVVASHIDGGLGALHAVACCAADSLRAVAAHFGQAVVGVVAAVDARRAKEDDRVLDLLAPEARQRLDVLRQQAQNSAVRTVEKWFVLIRQGGGLELWCQS